MKRTIAVVLPWMTQMRSKRFAQGIAAQAERFAWNVLVLSNIVGFHENPTYKEGAQSIYTLLECAQVDGVILCQAAASPEDAEMIEHATRIIEKRKLPCVVIGEIEGFPTVVDYGGELMERMCLHLMERHGARTIYFVGGYEGNPDTRERLAGYYCALARHAIKARAEWVFGGGFWYDAGEQVAARVLGGELALPDAFVCANDCVAQGLVNTLLEGGVRVPEDVRVSGFDASNEAFYCSPQIATVMPASAQLGMRALRRLYEIITGHPCDTPPVEPFEKARIIPASTCGCQKDIEYTRLRRRAYRYGLETGERDFTNCHMLDMLLEARDLAGFGPTLARCLCTLTDCKAFTLCLCEDSTSVYLREQRFFTSRMCAALRFVQGKSVGGMEFALNQLFPCDAFAVEGGDMHVLVPLHSGAQVHGYAVFTMSACGAGMDEVYSRFACELSNALEFLRVRQTLHHAYQQLHDSSLLDALTGIYNRKGLREHFPRLLSMAQEPGNKLLMLIADVDGLKFINDTYGHQAGDDAICAAATALSESCRSDDICVRMGGDELMLLACCGEQLNVDSVLINRIEETLKQYNAVSHKPYCVSLSIGYYFDKPQPGSTIQMLQAVADARMYSQKQRHRNQSMHSRKCVEY